MSGNYKPSFTDRHMIKIFHELNTGISVAATDFQKPTSAFVCNVYPSLLSYLDLDAGNISDFPAFQIMDYPEMHRSMMQTCLTAKYLQSFFNQINLTALQFQLSDLLYPTPARSRVFISELLNFILFAKENHERLNRVRECRKDTATRMESLQNTRDGLKNQYTNELVDVAARADKVKNYEAHVAAAEETKKHTKEEMKHQETFLAELQSEISEIEQRIAVRERTRIDKQNCIRNLECQLVLSPDRLRGEHQHLQDAEASTIAQVKERETTLHVRQGLLQRIEANVASASEVHAKALQVAKVDSNKKSVLAEIEKLQTQRKKLLQQLEQNEMQLCKVSTSLGKTTEEITALKLSTQERSRSMAENHQGYLRERERLEDLLDATEQRMNELIEEKEDLQRDKEAYIEYKQQAVQAYTLAHEHATTPLLEHVKKIIK